MVYLRALVPKFQVLCSALTTVVLQTMTKGITFVRGRRPIGSTSGIGEDHVTCDGLSRRWKE
jgi:hypothetical protein